MYVMESFGVFLVPDAWYPLEAIHHHFPVPEKVTVVNVLLPVMQNGPDLLVHLCLVYTDKRDHKPDQRPQRLVTGGNSQQEWYIGCPVDATSRH
ncbi:hypothetical protein ZHAS_00008978 [Anopheles sinensis]|uniref:Uncharacterized protein n=1 Tax=Anopheles sinensis TaxID=74873 RepID=A0A084VTT5_ANOSI|nr:hypothetical protein ZHAS_00008978 [Anopheles sinensis]